MSLGDSLGRNSKLVSGGGSKDITYYVSPSSKGTALGQDEKLEYAELEDNCHCHSISGRIHVGYYAALDLDMEEGKMDAFAWMREEGGGCCIVA